MKELDKAEAQLGKAILTLKKAAEQVDEQEESVMSAENKGEHKTNVHEDEKKERDKPAGTNRGIETMFRSAYRVQLGLTALADNKANMMISINGIIISIIIAAVAPKLDSNPWLLIPTSLLLLGNLVSIIFAILAAKPRVGSKPIDLLDLRHSKGNLLFFGNFYELDEPEFLGGMTKLMEDKIALYEAMMRDIYGLGSVLRLKFSLLRVAYTSFMVALILGVMSFIGVFVWILSM